MDNRYLNGRLLSAVVSGNIKEVEWLVSKGAEIFHLQWAPIWAAGYYGRREVFIYLMEEVERKAKFEGYKKYEREMENGQK